MTNLNFFRPLNRSQNGMILVSVLIVMAVLTLIGLALAEATTNQYTLAKRSMHATSANLVAEAGIEQSVQQINLDDSFAGFTSPTVFFDNSDEGYGVFTTVVAATGDTNAKTITSTGKVYLNDTTAQPISTRIVKVTVVGTSSEGYSVQTGAGGLILGGSADITNSNVYVNGSITLNGTSNIGSYNQPLSVYAANDICPSGSNPGPTYPQVCSDGTQPITMDYSTHIYGTVCATGQTSTGPNNNISGGSTGLGLKPGCTTPVATMPTYDRAGQISEVTTTGSGTDNGYVCKQWPFDRNWPANLELTGDVSLVGSCNVTVRGNAYITGNLNLGGSAKITVDDSVGTVRPVIIVDGTITVGNSAQIVANSAGTGVELISFKSSASCSPSCTSLSGNDLKNSQNLQTINVSGAVNLPGVIFDAYWSKITLSGSGKIGSAIGQMIDMTGAGTVTFGTTLSSGARTWTITSYQQGYP